MADPILRVLQVTAPGAYGGREAVVADLAVGLSDAGHQVHVLAVLDADADPDTQPFVGSLRREGVATTPAAVTARAYWSEMRVLRDLIAQTGAQIVHSHGYRTDVVAAIARRSCTARFVSTAHGYTGGGWKNRTYERLQAAAWRRYDAVIAVSGPLVTAVAERGLPRSRIRRIPNARRPEEAALAREEARARLGIDSGSFAIGWAGRITPEKGPDVALDAFTALDSRASDVELHFLGDGRMRGELVERARALNLEDRVIWHGSVPGAAALMKAFDLFLMSSRTEGTPLVLLEAISAGVPVVATAVGGIPDVVSDAEAWLVKPESPEILAGAIQQALDDPGERRSRASRAGNRLVQYHAFEPWIEAHVQLYEELLWAGKSNPRPVGSAKGPGN